MNRNSKPVNSILEMIGNTPLVKLNRIFSSELGRFYAKIESFNPGFSGKDRTALYIIEDAERKGLISPGDTIVETTSGNTGFSIAMISLVKGYNCILAVSDKSSPSKINVLRTLGAEVHVCPANVPADDPRSYYETAKRIQAGIPNSIYINQYFNSLNIDAHYNSTGREIWEQTKGKVTHVVVASGTGGTISGIGRYLHEKNPNIKILGVDAIGSIIKQYHEDKSFDPNDIKPYKIEGLGKNIVPGATDFDAIDIFEKVSDKNAALCSRELLQKEGIFCGYTSGAVVQATRQYADKDFFDCDSYVVVVFADSGIRYMDKIYDESWMNKNNFM